MLKSQEITLYLKGKGTTKEEAISKALSSIQKEIFKELNQLVVRAEPKHIDVIEALYNEYTERFLFILFPRKRQTCRVELKVIVHLQTIDPNEIDWEKTNKKYL